MKLAEFYAKVSPFLQGKAAHGETVRALWGDQPPARDAARLAIYGRFCRVHRFEAVDSVYSETRAAVCKLAGEDPWDELVERYFTAHPMHHVEINENGDELAPYLAAHAKAHGLPAWIAALAELEWWEWRTRIAADDPNDARPEEGKLRIAATVELRPFAWDLVGWLDQDPRAEAPDEEQALVIFWRDRNLKARREIADQDDLLILKAVNDGERVDPEGELAETLDDLRSAGIMLGAP